MSEAETGSIPPNVTPQTRIATMSELARYTILFALITLALDVVAAYFTHTNGDYPFAFGSGFIMGQLCLIVMACGLLGNNWTTGYLSACLMIATIFVAILFGTGLAQYVQFGFRNGTWFPETDVIVMAFVFPGAVFAAMAPMWVARSWLGWRLVREERSYPQFRSTLGGLFVNGVVMAGLFLTLRAPQVIWGYQPSVFWPSCVIIGLTMSVVWAAFTVPMARVVNVRSVWMQLLCLVGIACIVWTGVSMLPGVFAAAGSRLLPFTPNYRLLAISGASATTLLFVGIRILRADRFFLRTRGTDAALAPTHAATDLDKQHRTRTIFAQVIPVMLFALAVNAYVAHVQVERRALRQAGLEILSIVGPDSFAGGYHSSAQFNPLRPDVSGIRAANVTDDDVAKIFDILRRVDALDDLKALTLSDSKVTNRCIDIIAEASNLEALGIANTAVTGASFSQLAALPIEYLHAADLDLTETPWELLQEEKLASLYIPGSRISVDDFATFLEQGSFENLHALNLSKVEVNDRLMDAIADLLPRMSDTRGRSLQLNDTPVTDRHIAKLEGLKVHALGLAGTQITDACIDALANLDNCNSLDLGRTEITDAALPTLLQMQIGCNQLNIQDTKLTAKAILQAKGAPIDYLIVSEGQFTKAEGKALQNAGFDGEERPSDQ